MARLQAAEKKLYERAGIEKDRIRRRRLMIICK